MDDDNRIVMLLCMGSACHRLGVAQILPRLQELIIEFKIEDMVHLKGHFCLNNCSEGVVIKVGDKMVERVLPDNVDQVFFEHILPYILDENQSGDLTRGAT
ncbi:MAG: (2Fe-2S) ferredoxin domain-containing protein [Capsulimonadaceae bacterium]|nr:(2Fe-2S) ferredoxin domain-containing protein [Capsulimonadaceae bacterium]